MGKKNKHTPGKWEVIGKLDNIYVGTETSDGSWRQVAHVGTEDHNPPRYEEAEANAKLISAAPELLEALKTASLYISSISNKEDWEKVHSAIKKATE